MKTLRRFFYKMNFKKLLGEQSCFGGRCNARLQCTFRRNCPASRPRYRE